MLYSLQEVNSIGPAVTPSRLRLRNHASHIVPAMAGQGAFVKKILIGLVATVVILVVALVALNKQLKNPQQDTSVTEPQDAEQDRLPALSALTGQNKETGRTELMPLPKKTEDDSKPESDTIVSIDGETCEKLPPLDNYVLLPVSKPKNEAATTQGQTAQATGPAMAKEAGKEPPAAEANTGAGSPAPLAQAAAPAPSAQGKPAAGITESSRQELTDMLAAKQSGKTQQPGSFPGQSPATQTDQAEASSGTEVTAPVSLPQKETAPAVQNSSADNSGEAEMKAKDAEQAGTTKTPSDTAAAPVSLPQKDTAAAQSKPGKPDTRTDNKADSRAKDAKAGQADSAGKAGKTQQKQEQGTAKGAQPKIVIFSREKGATVRITMDRKIPYKQMILTNPDRLVIDIAGEYKNMQSPAFPENDFVSGIRIGHYDNRTRLVFDLKAAPARHHINQSGDQKRLDVRLDK